MNYFIIHGTMGHNRENWFGWLEDKLSTEGEEVFNLNYPTPESQNFEVWSAILDTVRKEINKKSVFICHSIAAVFLVRYCITNKIKIGKLISVAGANNFSTGITEYDRINKTMFTDNVSHFKKFCKDRICYYSKNDPYIKFADLEAWAKSIDADTKVYDQAGHFNQSAGYSKFEDILVDL